MKNRILLESYYLPGELENHIQQFINYYNHERYHESLNNLTPADFVYEKGREIMDRREIIKLETLSMRKQMHYDNQTTNLNLMR